jgi:hypothetical protein
VLLIAAREYFERALSVVRTRADERLIGERICELAALQDLEECRTLAEVQLLGCQHRDVANHRRAGTNAAGEPLVGADCVECGALRITVMPRDWDGTVYVWAGGAKARPRRVVL